MYHPLLVFERHTGCLLAARLRRGTAASHARIIPLLLRIVPRLQREFPNVQIKLRADAGFTMPLFYEYQVNATLILGCPKLEGGQHPHEVRSPSPLGDMFFSPRRISSLPSGQQCGENTRKVQVKVKEQR
jgi:Transposase DDE domain group 1